MKYSVLKASAVAGLIIAGSGVQAEEKTKQVFDDRLIRGVIGIGYYLGGTELNKEVTAKKGENPSIKTGAGFDLYAGILIRPKSIPFEFQATVGRLSETERGKNGKLELKRNTMNLAAFYRIKNKYRIGLGTTKHSSIKYSSNVDGSSVKGIDFEDSNGVFAEWGYIANPKVTLGVRLTKQEYKSKPNYYGETKDYSANSIGAFASYNF